MRPRGHASRRAQAGFPAGPATERRHHPPSSRRKKPPPRRRRPAPPPAPPVGPRGAADPDPGLLHHLHLRGSSHASRATAPRDDDDEAEAGYDAAGLEEAAAGDSFSHSLKECQKQLQLRAEARPPAASHELGNGDAFGGIELLVLSPRCLLGAAVGGMSKSSTASSRSRSGTFPSPGTPNYHRHCARQHAVPQGLELGAGAAGGRRQQEVWGQRGRASFQQWEEAAVQMGGRREVDLEPVDDQVTVTRWSSDM
ncbi:hypothetical protein ZWY2020_022831 [Hordeum vulgare]|nr:hypothetical protein ZWY2020_022831 [Hordeum vulgare]